MSNTLKYFKEKAHTKVQKVSNDPQGRYQLRYEFYEKYGDPIIKGKEGLGNSELAFMDWEIKRGVLNAMDASKPGSPWWREVNNHFLYVSTLAQMIKESGETFDDLSVPVRFWLEYINDPNEKTWYRAHNSSIIAGYRVADALAFKETVYEQYFMNIVLYRLLYAQSMVEGVSFGILGELFGNPRGCAVAIITHIESFYPTNYPLSQEDIKYVTHRAHNLEGLLEDVFDKIFILPHLNKLYTVAAAWNQSPLVKDFVTKNKPIYPITETSINDSLHFTNTLAAQDIAIF